MGPYLKGPCIWVNNKTAHSGNFFELFEIRVCRLEKKARKMMAVSEILFEKKSVLISFDKFLFLHACKCGTIVKFFETTIVAHAGLFKDKRPGS